MKKIWKKAVLAALSVTFLLGCPSVFLPEGSVLQVQAATPALSASSFRLIKGCTRTLKLKNASGTVKWASVNRSIATVTSQGVVKGIKAGKTTIKATCKGKSYRCTVIVEAPKLSASKLTMNTGTYRQLTLKNTRQSVTWKSSRPSIASVSSKGYVSAKKAGTSRITARCGGKTYSCAITVKKAPYTLSQGTLERNYQKVISCIRTNGTTNADGDPYIQLENPKEKTISSIVYDRSKKQLRFITVFYDDDGLATLDLYVNTPKSQQLQAQFNMVYGEHTQTPVAAQAVSSFSASSCTRNGKLSFTVTEQANISKSDVRSIAQEAAKTGFTGWNQLLYNRTGLRLKNLGFTSWR